MVTTARLVLRDFREDDLSDVHAWRSDPVIAAIMDFPPNTLDASRAWLAEAILHNREKSRVAYGLAITPREDDRVIGWIGFGRSERYDGPGEFGFGYALSRDFWGQGYATEAARAVVDYCFQVLGARRVSAWCRVSNRASARVLEKAGLDFARTFTITSEVNGEPIECREYQIRRPMGEET